MSLTVALREELAHADGDRAWRLAEVAAMVDLAGTLRLRGAADGTSVAVVVRCAEAAVARRLRSALVDLLDLRPVIARRQGSNLQGADAYLVEVTGPALHELGVLDEAGRPLRRDPATVAPAAAYVAGALMVAGTLSGVGAPVHLEIRATRPAQAAALSRMVAGSRTTGTRVVLKAGDAVADLLAEVGAHRTFLAFDQGRLRRDLRRQVTRSVNADRANLRRATAAAADQIHAIQRLVGTVGWDGLAEDLAAVALARVANPEASLSDLGELLDPPVAKPTVHRRLRRLMVLAEEQA